MRIKLILFSSLFTIALIGLFSFSQNTNTYKPGDDAMVFKLKNVDGKTLSMKDPVYKDAKGFIIIFTCNHCPYAKAYEDRIIALGEKYKRTYPVIAVNPNDPESYPDDSFENMQKRAKSKDYTFPYLIDETQEVAKAYGASKTPEVYLLEKEGGELLVRYVGAIDDNYAEPEEVKQHYLESAIAALESGQFPNPATTKAIGCSIKWKK